MIHHFTPGYVHGSFITVARNSALYEVPCKSNYVGILTAHVTDEVPEPTHSIDLARITGKFYCMPINLAQRYYAFAKLLH